MAFQKGHKKLGGKKKGTVNKSTAIAKEAFQMAFDQIGGTNALAAWAMKNQTDFYKIYGRLIPIDVNGNHNVKFEPLNIVQSNG